jgi:hypothetical protein
LFFSSDRVARGPDEPLSGHCEERSDEAIQKPQGKVWIASSPRGSSQ